MKKKLLAVLLATSMVVMSFTGCGQATEEKNRTEIADDVENEEDDEDEEAEEEVIVEESTEEPVEEPMEESVEEPIAVEMVTVEIAERGYDSFSQANDEYIIVGEDGKFGVIAATGEEVIPIEFDFYGTGFQDGCFALGKKLSETTRDCYLFAADLSVMYQNIDLQEYYISSYNEGIIQLTEISSADGCEDNIYLSDDTFEPHIVLNEEAVEGYRGASAVNNGTIMIQTFTHSPDGYFYCMLSMEKELKAGPPMWTPYPFAQTDSGYINGIVFDEATGISTGFGVCNVNTQEIVTLPPEICTTNTFYADGILVTATEDGYMSVQKEGTDLRAIYSVEAQEYVSDYKYSFIGMGKYGKEDYVLVSNEDGTQWGYLGKDMQEVGAWYTDATAFICGKAIIQDTDGLYYVVDTSFNKMSEGFEAEAAYALDSMENRFGILKDEKYYIVTVN